MSKLGFAIKERNQAGYLGLIPCIIPGFPNIAVSQEVTKFLDEAETVTALEFTFPASDSFSETANEKIISSNRVAVQTNSKQDIQVWLQTKTSNFIIVYFKINTKKHLYIFGKKYIVHMLKKQPTYEQRVAAVKGHLEERIPIKTLCSMFSVEQTAIYRWIKKYKQTGNYESLKTNHRLRQKKDLK
ncbi:MAG: transposase [Spirochaetota bacterium]